MWIRVNGVRLFFDVDGAGTIECQAAIASTLPAHLVRFERFAGCGHAVLPDAGERALPVIRSFIGDHRT